MFLRGLKCAGQENVLYPDLLAGSISQKAAMAVLGLSYAGWESVSTIVKALRSGEIAW